MGKRFGTVRVLESVDFELRAGEVHALLGQNGAGKSTLIKILAGVHSKDSGKILFGGEEVHFRTPADAKAAGVAVVYQELSLVPTMSVAANLFLGREPRKAAGVVDWRVLHREASRVLAENGLDLDPRQKVADLPFAYRQLLEIAKAVSLDARVLVLDEPTSSLTKDEEHILFTAMEGLRAKGVGIVYISHRMAEVLSVCDRVTVLRDGHDVGTYVTKEADVQTLVAGIVGPDRTEALDGVSTTGRADAPSGGAPAEGAPGSATRSTPAPSTRPTGRPVLELRDVRTARLNGASLAVRPGEILGLAGMVGSGRTEMLAAVFGLDRVTSGEVLLDGRPVSFRSPAQAIRAGIALVPEDRHLEGLVLGHSVERNINLTRLRAQSLRPGLVQRKESRRMAERLIERLGVKTDGPDTPVGRLSGGNQQKVVLGKWVEPLPRVLLLDEPTAGVDVGAKEEVYRLVRSLAAEGTAVVVASSELPELLSMCDHLAVVADRRVVRTLVRHDVRGEEHLHQLIQEVPHE
ncbi:sugar ABC transporter ATP-binding protein [Streptomyces sp. NPDC093250]|uniref:sugar ABC transporter ATP-binding protein n=1 Tax=Streptomyces sp. NPDC093250 TaxID=3366036 RepID=UPI0037F32548